VKKLSDLKPFDEVHGRYVVKFKKPVQRYAKGYRFELRIGDTSCERMLKFWGPENERAVRELYESIPKGGVIEVRGQANVFQDRLEITVNELDGIKVLSPEEYEAKEFVKISERDREEMKKELLELIEEVKDAEYRRVLDSFFSDEKFLDLFTFAPAALYKHHNWIGGLVEHTLNVANICKKVLSHYPTLDKDLVLTGALLHDIGKVREFEIGTSITVSREGMLLGHVVLGLQMLAEKLNSVEISKEKKLKLMHMLESHHGQEEYGSPKVPAFPEALLLHFVDYLDSSVSLMERVRRTAETEDDFFYTKDFGNVYLR